MKAFVAFGGVGDTRVGAGTGAGVATAPPGNRAAARRREGRRAEHRGHIARRTWHRRISGILGEEAAGHLSVGVAGGPRIVGVAEDPMGVGVAEDPMGVGVAGNPRAVAPFWT